MEYMDLAQNLANFGILIIIAAIFLWEHLQYKKTLNNTVEKYSNILIDIEKANMGITASLELLEKNMDIQQEFLKNLNKNCKTIEDNIKELKDKEC